MASLLKDNGHLLGLLFDFPLTEKGPPFGGSEEQYKQIFSTHFDIIEMDRAFNSIEPRQGNELFFSGQEEITLCSSKKRAKSLAQSW